MPATGRCRALAALHTFQEVADMLRLIGLEGRLTGREFIAQHDAFLFKRRFPAVAVAIVAHRPDAIAAPIDEQHESGQPNISKQAFPIREITAFGRAAPASPGWSAFAPPWWSTFNPPLIIGDRGSRTRSEYRAASGSM
jgi:hypothetical protein